MAGSPQAIERIEFGARLPSSTAEAILRATPILFDWAEQRAARTGNLVTNGSLAVSSDGDYYAINSASYEVDGRTVQCAEEIASLMAKRRNLRIISFHVTADEHEYANPCPRCRHSEAVMGGESVVSDVAIVTRQRHSYEHQVYNVRQLDLVTAKSEKAVAETMSYIVDENYERLMTSAVAICSELTREGVAESLDLSTASLIDVSWRD